MLRSGAYVIHDDGFYRGISPLSRPAEPRCVGDARLGPRRLPPRAGARPARRRQARPPVRRGAAGAAAAAERSGAGRALAGEVTAVNDQHAFLRLPGRTALDVRWHVVRLGLSHPCTAFDKWRLIPVVDDADAADPVVVDLIRTYF